MLPRWRLFVDIGTVVWLLLFVLMLMPSEQFEGLGVRTVSLTLLAVFVADLGVTYHRAGERPARFLRTHWLDVLLVIPYFRVFRILRVGRALRAVRLLRAGRGARVGRMAKSGLDHTRAVKKSKRATGRIVQ